MAHALALNVWQEYFEMYELTQIMRQKEDKQFAELLNQLQERRHSKNDIEQLEFCNQTITIQISRICLPLINLWMTIIIKRLGVVVIVKQK